MNSNLMVRTPHADPSLHSFLSIVASFLRKQCSSQSLPQAVTVPSPVTVAGHTFFRYFKAEHFPRPTSYWLIANNSYQLLTPGYCARHYADKPFMDMKTHISPLQPTLRHGNRRKANHPRSQAQNLVGVA